MITALLVIGAAAALVLLAARLREARDELDQARRERESREQAMREEQAIYTYAVAVSVACLLAGLAAACWYAPPPARAGRGRDAGQGSATGGADREAAR